MRWSNYRHEKSGIHYENSSAVAVEQIHCIIFFSCDCSWQIASIGWISGG